MIAIRNLCWLLALTVLGISPALAQAPTPETERYVWDLTDLYPTNEAWEAAYVTLTERARALNTYRGTLGDSAAAMAEALRAISDTEKDVLRLYIYASLARDEDQRVAEAQERYGKAENLFQELSEATSWIDPEILAIGEEPGREGLRQRAAKQASELSDAETGGNA